MTQELTEAVYNTAHRDDTRIGNCIQTYTGRRFWPLDPRANEVSELDIAHHLSNICRWTGACKRFYSVAQHSVHMAEWAAIRGWSVENQLACLLHDAAEAYTNDLSRPLKTDPRFLFWKEIEDRIMDAVWIRFHVMPGTLSLRQVKHLDDAMLVTEGRQLVNLELNKAIPSLPIRLPSWGPKTARAHWIGMFRLLQGREEFRKGNYWRGK